MNDLTVARPRRIATELPVDLLRFEPRAGLGTEHEGMILNLHAGGLCIGHRGFHVEPGDVVCVRFPAFVERSLNVCGTVRWWRETTLGIEVDRMGSVAMERYRQLVEELVAHGFADL